MEVRVWNYITMPVNAEIISVQIQNETLCLWAICDDDKGVETETRVIKLIGTGHPMPDLPREFIGTVQQGSSVWHIFEDIRRERKP